MYVYSQDQKLKYLCKLLDPIYKVNYKFLLYNSHVCMPPVLYNS